MSPETNEHRRIKEIILQRLQNVYGSALKEYPDSGNISDVFAITNDGIEIFIENVWTSTKNNFYRDLNTLRNSDAKVKIFVVNPEILKSKSYLKEYEKARRSETKKGVSISEMIDGSRILDDSQFIDKEFSQIVEKLVSTQRKIKTKFSKTSKEELNHSKRILLTRPDYPGLEDWAPETLMKNLLIHGGERLETKCLLEHFETGYNDELWKPLMQYKEISEKYGWLKLAKIDEKYFSNELDSSKKPTDIEIQQLSESEEQFLKKIEELIFTVQNGIPLKGRCEFCSN